MCSHSRALTDGHGQSNNLLPSSLSELSLLVTDHFSCAENGSLCDTTGGEHTFERQLKANLTISKKIYHACVY